MVACSANVTRLNANSTLYVIIMKFLQLVSSMVYGRGRSLGTRVAWNEAFTLVWNHGVKGQSSLTSSLVHTAVHTSSVVAMVQGLCFRLCRELEYP